jgi:hypothetical protein
MKYLVHDVWPVVFWLCEFHVSNTYGWLNHLVSNHFQRTSRISYCVLAISSDIVVILMTQSLH